MYADDFNDLDSFVVVSSVEAAVSSSNQTFGSNLLETLVSCEDEAFCDDGAAADVLPVLDVGVTAEGHHPGVNLDRCVLRDDQRSVLELRVGLQRNLEDLFRSKVDSTARV